MSIRFLYDCEILLNHKHSPVETVFVLKDEVIEIMTIIYGNRGMEIYFEYGSILGLTYNLAEVIWW